jgi:predicted transcriptional regulator
MNSDIHWLQKQVQTRIGYILFVIKERNEGGVEEKDVVDTMFVEYGVHPRTTREYLSRLTSAGKIKKEGSTYYFVDKRRES